jgi:hypothetical protein
MNAGDGRRNCNLQAIFSLCGLLLSAEGKLAQLRLEELPQQGKQKYMDSCLQDGNSSLSTLQ